MPCEGQWEEEPAYTKCEPRRKVIRLPLIFQQTHLCCRQWRSWDVTPPPQLREHAVHLVHSPHQ